MEYRCEATSVAGFGSAVSRFLHRPWIALFSTSRGEIPEKKDPAGRRRDTSSKSTASQLERLRGLGARAAGLCEHPIPPVSSARFCVLATHAGNIRSSTRKEASFGTHENIRSSSAGMPSVTEAAHPTTYELNSGSTSN